ncbi:MAG: bifunctional oligoribonuclease/PAP phosphatase NrnA, partial [Bradymonadaceae bacterium]
FIRIDRETLGDRERVAELTDGFINYGRSIRGVEVSTQLRELADGNWKVTFRSVGNVDVSELASRFGGGGHRNAAGCVVDGTPDAIEADLTQALIEMLDE